ncbi:hypothetical protein ACUH7A_004605 [Yersinia enterocolitica]|uniref:hypothetical protein n=1 Tax=Yersinia TaxID=629 RepID=UPI0005E155E7|nr:hypothetical protein [Yersinia intermedia]EKN6368128.1 hypothetical protein [Yersinia enterocolitica]ELI8124963.1 hypothetical protein [Yersinia enterocolitica]CNI94553.1 Uncharacterised protein [Yersinia intermedia]HEN3434165.1 hypothetical protein [Yersinia enterocolitica]
MLPKIDKTRTTEGNFSINQSKDMVGKTVKEVHFGFAETHKSVHDREVLIIEFTDGTKLAISTGSNVQNVCHDHPKLKPNDFHTDLDLTWEH